jgi:hypothetical protein
MSPRMSETKNRRSIFSPTLFTCQLTRRRNGESNNALIRPNIGPEVSSGPCRRAPLAALIHPWLTCAVF